MTESPSRVRSHTDVIQRHGHGVDDVRLAPDDLHRRRLGLGSHGEGQTSEGESEGEKSCNRARDCDSDIQNQAEAKEASPDSYCCGS